MNKYLKLGIGGIVVGLVLSAMLTNEFKTLVVVFMIGFWFGAYCTYKLIFKKLDEEIKWTRQQ